MQSKVSLILKYPSDIITISPHLPSFILHRNNGGDSDRHGKKTEDGQPRALAEPENGTF